MGLSHSSVSIQIKALEDELGITLCKRSGPRLTLTREGREFYEKALPCLEGIENLYEQFHKETKIAQKTELQIAANSTAMNFILPKISKEYLADHEDVFLTLHLNEHDDAIAKLESKQVDLALLPRREHKLIPSTCEYIPIFFFPPALITRQDHPLAGKKNLTVAEISRYELTLPSEELQVIPNLHRLFKDRGIDKRLRIKFTNAETGRQFIETGQTITISSTVWIHPKDILVATPLTHILPIVDYGIVMRKEPHSSNVKRFVETAKQVA